MERIESLYRRYNLELRPLIIEYEAREMKFPEVILGGIILMFDNLVGYHCDSSIERLNESEKNLDKVIRILQEYVTSSYKNHNKELQSRYQLQYLESVGNGEFYAGYSEMMADAQRAIDAGNFSRAITVFRQIEALEVEHKQSLFAVGRLQEKSVSTIVKFVLSTAISVILGLIVANFL